MKTMIPQSTNTNYLFNFNKSELILITTLSGSTILGEFVERTEKHIAVKYPLEINIDPTTNTLNFNAYNSFVSDVIFNINISAIESFKKVGQELINQGIINIFEQNKSVFYYTDAIIKQ